ncbi:unnamed protein product [Rotaria magnacalcarata]|uniref:Arrestin C-terminal-like domain-containing protein n=1 Tax=Rotaria magnacalcarata TaxID=392030 RepID=A0A816W3R5_9BILA|nr:unnamed protein product [Rotaria magnacalcarata]CAF1580315.1 unnamed protein product [Rotaria magnacalcarata]CAF2043851.1 unnamed protein product [Rotaria magnacalcarata]CAF2120922.1 unnamed protein product [Rotaria magnacalcarata]CAF2128716.1 unnamed protein product [Rotaria magnacalcarata]
MGANESAEIQVNFNHPNSFYSAGEQITGNISFQSTHEKLTLDGLFLEFIGELGFTTRETKQQSDSNGRTRAEPFTEYHRIAFMTVCFPVVQPQYGQHEIILYRGQYSWPFQFTLPQCLPPSSVPMTIEYPYVKYFMRVVLNKPWYKLNKKQIYPLIIFPRVSLNQIPSAQQAVPFAHANRKKLQVDGHLLRAGFIAGSKLSFQISLQNPKRCEIKKIVATLIQHRQIAQTHHSEIIFRSDLVDLHEFSGTQFDRIYNLQIPSVHLAPTYTYMSQCCAPSINVDFNYELKLDVKARGLFTDFTLRVPVIIGTEPTLDQQELINSYVEMPPPSAPVYDFDEPPPAYESVVSNFKQ